MRRMPAAPQTSKDASVPAALGRVRFRRGLAAVAFMLVVGALGLRWLAETETDLPPMADFLRDARDLYLPAAQGEIAGTAPEQNHTPGARAWVLTGLKVNGHWDARVLAVAHLALLVIGFGVLAAILERCVSGAWKIGLTVGGIVLILIVPLVPIGTLEALSSGGLVVLSLLHLGLMSRSRPSRWLTTLGFFCGLLNVLGSTAGLAAPTALVIWSGILGRRDQGDGRAQRSVLWLNFLLVSIGVGLAVVRSSPSTMDPAFLAALPVLLAWPFQSAGWAGVVWAPAFFGLRQMGRQTQRGAWAKLSLLVLWVPVQLVVLAALHVGTPAAAREILLVGLLANAACFAVFAVENRRGSAWKQVLLGLWAIAIVNALLYPATILRDSANAGPALEAPLTAALRRAAFDGDATLLRASGAVSEMEQREWLKLFSDKNLRRILPGSIRPPLAIASTANVENGFRVDGTPTLPGRDGLPAWGTWSVSTAGLGTGDFVSQPIETRAPFLQIRVNGALRPPATTLRLRTADGREIAPIEEAFAAEDRWKRVNFMAPRGAFQIIAHDASPTAWLAFTAPQEVGRLTWLAGKIVRAWPWWLAAGLMATGTAMALGWRAPADSSTQPVRRSNAAFSGVAWPALPWLAVIAYAVFFSHHIDATAGPNDSGGYLNSAKLLVEGHVTGSPRLIFGAAAGETDIAPYLPTTFRETGEGRMAPEYPVGFPLEVWAVAKLSSLATAVPVVILLQLVLGVLFTRWLAGAVGLPDGWSWLASGIIGLSPVYLFQGLQPQSDGPAMVWVTAAIYWAWSSREKPGRAWLAGLATALAVMIRPSNALVVVPLLICFAGHRRQLTAWVLAGLPAAGWLLWYNHTLYGNAFTTGYGEIGTGFALRFAPLTWGSYVRWLPVMLTPVVGLAAMAPAMQSIPVRLRVMLSAWVAVFVGFYTFYWCTYDNWYNMRFVLPAAPAMVILGLFVVRGLTERMGFALFSRGTMGRATVPSVVLVAGLLAVVVADTWRRDVIYWMHANRNYAVAGEWARTHFPANAVVFAKPITGPLEYYTDLVIVRSDHPQAQSREWLDRIARTGRPIFAVTSHWERKGFKWGAGRGDGYPDIPGRWERLASLCGGEILTWAWRPD